MHRLTREVRFALTPGVAAKVPNAWSAHPPIANLEQYFTLRVTVKGEVDPASSYLLNIKTIDEAVRFAMPLLCAAYAQPGASPASLLSILAAALPTRLAPASVDEIELLLSPLLSHSLKPKSNMLYLHQHFEFSAAHRLHNPALSDADNRATFGKCNNPAGHGHNYQIKVSLTGSPDASGRIFPVATLDQIVNQEVIDHLDHKHLNEQVPEFDQAHGGLNPSVENIAMVIFRRLAAHVSPARLASVTVWETPKTWAEYSE